MSLSRILLRAGSSQPSGPFMGQLGSSAADANSLPGMQALLHGMVRYCGRTL